MALFTMFHIYIYMQKRKRDEDDDQTTDAEEKEERIKKEKKKKKKEKEKKQVTSEDEDDSDKSDAQEEEEEEEEADAGDDGDDVQKTKEEDMFTHEQDISQPRIRLHQKELLSSRAKSGTAARGFQRVDVAKWSRAAGAHDNSYFAMDSGGSGYGAKAEEVLSTVRGSRFRHEKTKKKRGSYRGGVITNAVNSIKFDF